MVNQLGLPYQIYYYNLKLQRTFRPKIQLGHHTTISNFPKTA